MKANEMRAITPMHHMMCCVRLNIAAFAAATFIGGKRIKLG